MPSGSSKTLWFLSGLTAMTIVANATLAVAVIKRTSPSPHGTSSAKSYTIAKFGSVKDIDHQQSDQITDFVGKVWTRSSIEAFRCRFDEGKDACRGVNGDGKTEDAALSAAQAKKLRDITRRVWENEGLEVLSYVECSLAKLNPKCQVMGGVSRPSGELKAGECVIKES